MTIKQISLLISVIAVTQTNTMQQQQSKKQPNPQLRQPIVFVNNGTFTNYGTTRITGQIQNNHGATIENFATLNIQPHYQQKHPQTQYYHHTNVHNIYRAPKQTQTYNSVLETRYPTTQQKALLEAKNKEQDLRINELLTLPLQDKQHKQLKLTQQLSSVQERLTIGEMVLEGYAKDPVIQKFLSEKSILDKYTQDPATEKYIRLPQKEASQRSLFFATPRQTLQQPVERSLWSTTEDFYPEDLNSSSLKKITSPACTPLELAGDESSLSTWNKIITTNTRGF